MIWFWLLFLLAVASLAVAWTTAWKSMRDDVGYKKVSRVFRKPFATLDVTLRKGERVACDGELDATENGIKVWNGRKLERAPDMRFDYQLVAGSQVYVEELGAPVILQVMEPDLAKVKSSRTFTKGVHFVSLQEQVFGKQRNSGMLYATEDGFAFKGSNTFHKILELKADTQHSLVVPIPPDYFGDTHITLASGKLFWRGTVFFNDKEMRLITQHGDEETLKAVRIQLDKTTTPRSDNLYVDIHTQYLPEEALQEDVHLYVVNH